MHMCAGKHTFVARVGAHMCWCIHVFVHAHVCAHTCVLARTRLCLSRCPESGRLGGLSCLLCPLDLPEPCTAATLPGGLPRDPPLDACSLPSPPAWKPPGRHLWREWGLGPGSSSSCAGQNSAVPPCVPPRVPLLSLTAPCRPTWPIGRPCLAATTCLGPSKRVADGHNLGTRCGTVSSTETLEPKGPWAEARDPELPKPTAARLTGMAQWAERCPGCRLDSQSGHKPRLRVWCPAGGRTRGNQSMFLSLPFSLPSPSLETNKIFSPGWCGSVD